MLHRASMQAYHQTLVAQQYDVDYRDESLRTMFAHLQATNIRTVHYAEVTDYLLQRRINRYAQRAGIQCIVYPSPNFICTPEYLHDYFQTRKRYFLTDFYIEQRKRFAILMNGNEPAGGKWTYDTENRKRLPAGTFIPPPAARPSSPVIREAQAYVQAHYPNNPGTCDPFLYPVTHADALAVLDDFLTNRFVHYGVYQDALVAEQSFLFHSLLTPALNIGLLDPLTIIDRALAAAVTHSVPLNSLEGFIRQVIGWREFIRAVYEREGVKQRTTNYWGHTNHIPDSFWSGTTGIDPVDTVIRRVHQTAYSHHIERLMVLGNFMLLCEFHPDDVYTWFMSLYIDAYDWVMVPNVYGMSQYADGGLMSTKPYVSGSNYILSMSNFRKGAWCNTWDALYWGFIHQHREQFRKNPRMSMMVRQLEKMDAARRNSLLTTRDHYLATLR